MADTILVTGATGTIGSQLVKQLSDAGASVRAFVRSPEKAASIQYPNVDIVERDMAKPETLDAAFRGVDKVFLLSSPDPNQVTLQGNVIEAAKRANFRHVVKLSAIGVAPESPISLAVWHWQDDISNRCYRHSG